MSDSGELLNAYLRLEEALKTVVPPIEKLTELTDAELLGYANCVDAQWQELGQEWTKRKMQQEAMRL